MFNDIVNLFVQDIKIIHEMLQQGKTSTEISLTMGIPSSTIRTHVRNHPEIYGSKSCRNCGQIMVQPIGRKVKYFCSDRFRMAWWSNHREQVQKKTYYTLVCAHCGKEFESYGNQNRKYCSRDCYLIARFHPPSRTASAIRLPWQCRTNCCMTANCPKITMKPQSACWLVDII